MTDVQRSDSSLLLPSCCNLSYGISEQPWFCDVLRMISEFEAQVNASAEKYRFRRQVDRVACAYGRSRELGA